MLILLFALCLSFTLIAVVLIIKKHRNEYSQGRISRAVFLSNTILDTLGLFLAITLAGLLGRYLGQIMAVQFANEPAGFIAGIVIGLLMGLTVGRLVRRTLGRLVKV